MGLGYILKRKRKQKGLSLNDLREKTGLSKSSLSNIENDKNNPTIDTLNKICDALDLLSEDVLSTLKAINESNISGENLNAFIDVSIHSKSDIHSLENIAKEEIALSNEYHKENTHFNSAEEAMKFILEQPAVMGYGGFNLNDMSDKDKIDFANDLLYQLKLLSYKYKK